MEPLPDPQGRMPYSLKRPQRLLPSHVPELRKLVPAYKLLGLYALINP